MEAGRGRGSKEEERRKKYKADSVLPGKNAAEFLNWDLDYKCMSCCTVSCS